jgi:hypothetical protein
MTEDRVADDAVRGKAFVDVALEQNDPLVREPEIAEVQVRRIEHQGPLHPTGSGAAHLGLHCADKIERVGVARVVDQNAIERAPGIEQDIGDHDVSDSHRHVRLVAGLLEGKYRLACRSGGTRGREKKKEKEDIRHPANSKRMPRAPTSVIGEAVLTP